MNTFVQSTVLGATDTTILQSQVGYNMYCNIKYDNLPFSKFI